MNKTSKKLELLGSYPVPKALLALGIPTMIGMMINAIYNLVDAYFVGGLGTYEMGAISIAFPLTQVIVGLGLLFGNGAASYISRLLGKGDSKGANSVASTALYSSLIVGLGVIILSIIFLEPILRFLGATDNIMPHAISYSRIILIASIFNVFNVTMNNIVTSEGAAKMTMYVLIIGAVLNVGLDPLLIYGLNFKVAGAAIATAIAQMVSALLYIYYIGRKKSMFSFQIKDCCFTKENFKEIMKIGVPTLVFQLLTSISLSLINMRSVKYGESVIAGMGAVSRIIAMGSLMVFGFIKGFQPIAGFSYGAKKYDRLKEAIKLSTIWSTIFCVIYGITMVVIAPIIMDAFTKGDSQMFAIGENALRANGVTFSLFGFITVYSSLFLALGKARSGFILGALRQGICFIPSILFLPMLFRVNGIIIAQPVADVLSAIIILCSAIAFHKELAKNKVIC